MERLRSNLAGHKLQCPRCNFAIRTSNRGSSFAIRSYALRCTAGRPHKRSRVRLGIRIRCAPVKVVIRNATITIASSSVVVVDVIRIRRENVGWRHPKSALVVAGRGSRCMLATGLASRRALSGHFVLQTEPGAYELCITGVSNTCR